MNIPQHILDLAERLRTQDNHGTSHPAYCVQQLERIYGLEDGDEWTWHNNDDWEAATPEEAKELDAKDDDGEDTGSWVKVRYRDDWRTVMTFLTLEGAEGYIANNLLINTSSLKFLHYSPGANTRQRYIIFV